jgi:toxin ParE1/3/4
MNSRYEVCWFPMARQDVISIAGYIALDDPAAAYRVFDQLEEHAVTLDRNPERGRMVPELRGHGGGHIYRELIVAPWRIFYRIEGATVLIVAVVDGRRSIPDFIVERGLGSTL